MGPTWRATLCSQLLWAQLQAKSLACHALQPRPDAGAGRQHNTNSTPQNNRTGSPDAPLAKLRLHVAVLVKACGRVE